MPSRATERVSAANRAQQIRLELAGLVLPHTLMWVLIVAAACYGKQDEDPVAPIVQEPARMLTPGADCAR